MRPATLRFAAATALVLLGLPAVAQQRLPTTSRAEREIDATNRAMRQQQQSVGQQQQNQFEVNQLRNQIQRDSISPPLAPGRTGCPAGSIGC